MLLCLFRCQIGLFIYQKSKLVIDLDDEIHHSNSLQKI